MEANPIPISGPPSSVALRDLTTDTHLRDVVDLERAIWELPLGLVPVPLAMLQEACCEGGIVLGAFDGDGAMIGFVCSTPTKRSARIHHSHLLGVLPSARCVGVGTRLKRAQRERAARLGVESIEWTFDPLQSVNAYFNLRKLGAVARRYGENIYGDGISPLHAGLPTDRLYVEWPVAVDLTRTSVLKQAGDDPIDSEWLEDPERLTFRRSNVSDSEHGIFIKVPWDFTMFCYQHTRSLTWRLDVRRLFQQSFSMGYEVVDFDRRGEWGVYVLTRR
jgi:predicted GNAT superfamily acetyltransferase